MISVDPPRSPDFVQSLERGLSILLAFDRQHTEMTLSEVVERTGLTRTAARRFLLTLEQLGYVRNEQRRYRLRSRVLNLGFAYLASVGVADVADEHMKEFVRTHRFSTSLGVLDDDEIVYVARADAGRLIGLNVSVGMRLPALSTSIGRVLLSELDAETVTAVIERSPRIRHTRYTMTDQDMLINEITETRRRGWCFVDQEVEYGLRALAVPIRNSQREAVAALNVSVPTIGITAHDAVRGLLPHLKETADRIERELRDLSEPR